MTLGKFRLLSSLALIGTLAFGVGCQCKPKVMAAKAPEAEAPVAKADPDDVRIEGDHLVIDNKIHFATDSDEILDDSTELLDHIATLLNNHSELSTVHVVGHTDATGDADHNQELSEKRAAAVVSALRAREVTQALDSRGAGETQPSCSDDTPECHQENRRVEFLVEFSDG